MPRPCGDSIYRVEIEWTAALLSNMAGLDKGIARRVNQAVERFAEVGLAT